jgi:hypothetical protein
MKTLSLGMKIVVSLFSGLTALAFGFAFVPAPAVYADEGTPPAPGRQHARLERCLRLEQEWLARQQDRLDHTDEVAARVQEFIDQAQAEGKDTSALEAALAAFQSQVATAQSQHDAAADILSEHAGYDDDGKVTDPELARETCRSAGQALRDARRTLNQAGHDLRRAIRDWRRANRPAPSRP